jgi:hypothetical protein
MLHFNLCGQVLDIAGDGQRDSGPVVTKWEQLQLAPELLRSLSKFGLVFTTLTYSHS